MYRRTLNNKSSIPNTHYSLQQDNLIHNFNQLNFNDLLRQDENVYNDDVYVNTRYNNNNNNNIDNKNLFYPNNNTSNVNNVGFENNNYIHYIYPYGKLNNHNITEIINTPAYNLYQIDPHNNNNNIHDLNVKYYSNPHKNYYDQNQKYNKKKFRNEGNQNNKFINNNNNNNNNNLKRWNSYSTSDLPFNTKYLTSGERYFHDPIDIQLMKEQNNNKPFISVQLNTTCNNSKKYDNHNHNHNHNYSNNFKYKKNSNQRDNTQKNALLYSEEQLLIQAKNTNQKKLNQLYNLISKPYNNKQKNSQPLFYMAGLENLPIYSFDELITYEEVDTMLENVDEEKIQLSVDKHLTTGLEQYFKRFIKRNIQPVDGVVRVLDSTAALTITQNVFASIDNTTSNNDHDTEADISNGNSTQINDDEDEGDSNNESENGNKNKIKNNNSESNNYNPNIKKSVRNLVQTKTSVLPFNKQLQQYSNDSFELSFDGKAMDRSDIFRMVDSFSIVFDNDRDPNTSDPNINNPNGGNSNTQPFNLSENILPEEMTNNLVY